jgi:N-acetylgalactosamine-6-sulfatase
MKHIFIPLLLSISVCAAADVKKPNIIFILADDMGWADLRCQGHPYAQTPNLDRLASEGTRFTQHYATGVTCCPSRTGFMTGKFPATFAKYPSGAGFGDRVTITELLKKQGYATAHFGKWHIGPVTENGTYGIDSIGAAENESGGKKKQNRDTTASARGRDAHMYDQAIRFIEQHSRAERDSLPQAARRAGAEAPGNDGPFYINIWDHIPHHPVNPSQAIVDAFGPLEVDESKFSPPMREKFEMCKKLGGDVSAHMRAYLAEIKAMDAEIGVLLKKLDELGLTDNTLVAFASDQGAGGIRETAAASDKKKKHDKPKKEGNTLDIRLNAMGYAGPFREGKHDQHEGGVRIPWIIRWPGHVPAGRVDEKSVLSAADWLPTLCALTGEKIAAADFDGEDASAAWLGRDFTRTKPLFWKTNATNSNPAMRVQNWKFHGTTRNKGSVELYDLATDPGEATNLADQKPEVVSELTKTLATWTATLPKSYDKTDEKGD